MVCSYDLVNFRQVILKNLLRQLPDLQSLSGALKKALVKTSIILIKLLKLHIKVIFYSTKKRLSP